MHNNCGDKPQSFILVRVSTTDFSIDYFNTQAMAIKSIEDNIGIYVVVTLHL